VPVDIQPAKIPVILLYNVDPDWTQDEKDEVIQLTTQLGQVLIDAGHQTVLVPVTDDDVASHLDRFDPADYIVFNWCECLPGIEHSEWLVAKQLELLNFTFTGADSDTLALTQDKFRVKAILDQAQIPTPAWHIFYSPEKCEWDKYPAIVKPMNEHCSAGITSDAVVLNHAELRDRISFVLNQYNQPALVEDFIDGREFHVSVWGNEVLTILPPVEMDFSFFGNIRDRLCTYDSKFIPGSEHYEKIDTLLPSSLTSEETEALEQVCKSAYRALGCRDYARLDIRLRDNIFYVLDINPNADISMNASMASAAEETGIDYAQMSSLIVRMAARRHPAWNKAQKTPRKRKRSNAKILVE